MHSVSEPELEDLIAGNASLFWTFFGISFGALLSFISVLLTVPVESAKAYATFFALCVLFVILTAAFFALAVRSLLQARRKVNQIKVARLP